MNKVHFNYITIQNFFSVGPEIKIDFNQYPGISYVYGLNKDLNVKNGSGKSTIFVDAILFALFNKTIKKVNKVNIPHRLSKNDCFVKLNFMVNEDEYTIENYITPTHCKLFKNSEDITKSSIKETYDYIEEEVIKSSFIVFRNCLVLSISGFKNIFEMTKYEKRNFVEQMMNFSQIGTMYSMTKEDLNTLDKELAIKRQTSNSLEKDINQFKKSAISFNDDKTKTIERLNNELNELLKESQNLEIDDSKYLAAQKFVEDKLKENDTNLNTLLKSKDRMNKLLAEINSDISNSNNIRSKYSKVIDVICESCKDHVDNILGLDSIQETITNKKNELSLTTAEYEKNIDEINNLQSLHSKLNLQKQNLIKKINEISSNKNIKNRIQKNIDEKNNSINTETNKVSPFHDLIIKYTEDLKVTNEIIQEQVEKRKYLDIMSFIFSEDGVKKHLILDFINILNSRIKKYLEEMGCEYTCIFDANFECEFLTISGPCEYSNFSAGERARIDCACLFSFRDLLYGQGTLQTNILICDEILDTGVDEFAITSIIKILKEISMTQNIFLISHRECVSPEDFNRVITVEKVNGYTTIKMEDN